MTHTEVY